MYGAYTVTGVVPYLADIGKSTATNKKNSFWGGVFGGGAFLIAVMILNFGLLANIKEVYNLEIPSLFVAASISPVFGNIFSILLLLGIYTTAVPMLYTVCNKLSSDSKGNRDCNRQHFRRSAVVLYNDQYYLSDLRICRTCNLCRNDLYKVHQEKKI